MEQLVNKIYIGIDASKAKLDIKYDDDESSAMAVQSIPQGAIEINRDIILI